MNVDLEKKYVKLYEEHHKKIHGYGTGGSVKQMAKYIKSESEKQDIKTVLDFGCGKARVWSKSFISKLALDSVDLYDPAIPKYSNIPKGVFDCVICSDVLEHIPFDNIDATLFTIFSKSEKVVFLWISTRLAKAILPNGENAHCSVFPKEWWIEKVKKHKPSNLKTFLFTKHEKKDPYDLEIIE